MQLLNTFNHWRKADNDLSDEIVQKCLQALQEMLGQTDATESDLQTSFKALASEPDAQKKAEVFRGSS